MLAIEFADYKGLTSSQVFSKISSAALDAGLLLLGCGADHNAVRFAAPLNSTESDIDEGLAVLEQVLQSL